jgi:hypothetical protein
MLIEKYCDACAEKEVKWQLMDIINQILIIISSFTSFWFRFTISKYGISLTSGHLDCNYLLPNIVIYLLHRFSILTSKWCIFCIMNSSM